MTRHPAGHAAAAAAEKRQAAARAGEQAVNSRGALQSIPGPSGTWEESIHLKPGGWGREGLQKMHACRFSGSRVVDILVFRHQHPCNVKVIRMCFIYLVRRELLAAPFNVKINPKDFFFPVSEKAVLSRSTGTAGFVVFFFSFSL